MPSKTKSNQSSVISKQSARGTLAYCFADGVIRFGRKLPTGALGIARAPKAKLEKAIWRRGRLAYDGNQYLVPGIPEAAGTMAAVDALLDFTTEIKRILAD